MEYLLSTQSGSYSTGYFHFVIFGFPILQGSFYYLCLAKEETKAQEDVMICPILPNTDSRHRIQIHVCLYTEITHFLLIVM